ncbi:transcriptional regulator, AlpA family [Shimia gijangensis]|uniref:Transcriptional regulator, AlpA family n=1 Tax=Shimia gijangensis TaxID=1470563 RepID=A0A1M6SBT8_9RHOB|nr:AlpA family phage regulatory protein [Shimia gijangensis]SHK42089.1 transcriptional regulator, AlpA family [Shimia gijangensis]
MMAELQKELIDKRLNAKHVASLLSIDQSTLWGWIKNDPTFPKPFRLGPRSNRWRLSEIEKWEQTKRQEPVQ